VARQLLDHVTLENICRSTSVRSHSQRAAARPIDVLFLFFHFKWPPLRLLMCASVCRVIRGAFLQAANQSARFQATSVLASCHDGHKGGTQADISRDTTAPLVTKPWMIPIRERVLARWTLDGVLVFVSTAAR